MWEQVKWAMVESISEVCGSVRGGEKESKQCVVKAAVRKKEAAWKEVMAASDEEAKENVLKRTEKKRERLKGVYRRAKIK